MLLVRTEYDFELGGGFARRRHATRYFETVIYVLLLKIHKAEVQSCIVRASYIFTLRCFMQPCTNLNLDFL